MTGIDENTITLRNGTGTIDVLVTPAELRATLSELRPDERMPLEATARWMAEAWRPTTVTGQADTLVITSQGAAGEHDARIALDVLQSVRSAEQPFQALGERAAAGWVQSPEAAQPEPAEATPPDFEAAGPTTPDFEAAGPTTPDFEAAGPTTPDFESEGPVAPAFEAIGGDAPQPQRAAAPGSAAFETIGEAQPLEMPDVRASGPFTLTLSSLGSDPSRTAALLRQVVDEGLLPDELTVPLALGATLQARDVRRIMVAVGLGTDATFAWAETI